jgi:homoserine O-acetyltransferase
VPATGAWQQGHPVGGRRFHVLPEELRIPLEAGGSIGGLDRPVTLAFEAWGDLNEAKDNAVLVLHALTGDSHVIGPAGDGHPTPGWWEGLVGPGMAVDTDRFFVLAPNVLGGCQGSTGPASPAPDGRPWGSRFPTITVRDQVAVERALLDALGIERLHAAIGGSMGGMRALEWAVSAPERIERLIVLACGPAATAEQIALCHVQSEAIRADPAFAGGDYYDAAPGRGPWRGLGVARQVGQISYRSRAELLDRFGREHQLDEAPLHGGRYAVEGYLDHHAAKLAWRFDANSYLVLSRAMDHHDVGRGRGGIGAALGRVRAETTVIGIDSDRLYYLDEQATMVELIPDARELVTLSSPSGHDAFLLEVDALGPVVSEALR